VETLYYPAMLYWLGWIFTQHHYILWKHPIHRGEAIPRSPTPITDAIQDRGSDLRRILLPRTRVNKARSRRARVRCLSPSATFGGYNSSGSAVGINRRWTRPCR
jgi:hypothetical protein